MTYPRFHNLRLSSEMPGAPLLHHTGKALSDPTRRHILELLRERDMTAGELAEQFNMSKPSISHHLTTLKTAGLVTDERHGQNIIYSLNTTVMQDLIGWFMGFMDGDGNVNQANDQTGNK